MECTEHTQAALDKAAGAVAPFGTRFAIFSVRCCLRLVGVKAKRGHVIKNGKGYRYRE